MTINNLLDRTWKPDYTCFEFLCEAWQQVTGLNLQQRLDEFLNGSGEFASLDEPISPCIVFFTNGSKSSTHVGLFYLGRVLHLTPLGAQFMPIETISIRFKETRFYK
ncbi:hypothetical protein RFK95_12565 [Acinetobacter pittii]|uniref:hypothetical protein n=1 Tax=Acinetobacter TaxID=469 RepID=UPI0006478625|nr:MULTISPECIES: hypothetical protein [Acinetobacter]MBM0875738.1 hypothetical protein [Acinetobacter pittii]MDQ9033699.1 hypothetical protein [Acinetobacter pittii]MDQ9078675.1 hypothetical protein [Acinetobacter pittii]